jgi:hypothetical protein
MSNSQTNKTEIEDLVMQKQTQARPVSNETLIKYIKQYEYLTLISGNKSNANWMTNTTEKSVIKYITDLQNVSASGRLNYLNIFVMIKKMRGLSIALLEKERELLMKEKQINAKDDNDMKKFSLPNYDTIKEYINDLYKQSDYVNYLVNELIFLFGFRNKDVDIYIIKLENYKKLTDEEKKLTNWLIIKASSCELIINNYKTSNTYGAKNITTKSRRIQQASTSLGEGWLLQTAQGVHATKYDYYIRLYQGLTERDYYRINISYLQSKSNSLDEINKLARNRGSSLAVANQFYNVEK